ncbi:MAG: phage tailspike protein [Thiohalomonadales bacterium]
MALGTIKLNVPYFPDPKQGRPIYNGSVYIGKVGLDPEVEANRSVVYLRQAGNSDVTILPAAQPLTTGSGGMIMYQGSTAEVLVDGNYSLKILDSQLNQAYYSQDVLGDPQKDKYPLSTGTGVDYLVNVGAGSYQVDTVYRFQVHTTNTVATGTTLTYDTLAQTPLKRIDGSDLLIGNLIQGMIAETRFDGTNLILLNEKSVSPPTAFIGANVHLNVGSLSLSTTQLVFRYDAAFENPQSDYDLATGLYTASIAGLYRFSGWGRVTDPAAGNIIQVRMNHNIQGLVLVTDYTVGSNTLVVHDYNFDEFVRMAVSETLMFDLFASGSGATLEGFKGRGSLTIERIAD